MKVVYKNSDELVQAAATRVAEIAARSIEQRDSFTLALAGGSTPRALYQLLATAEWRDRIDWRKTYIFFGDERAVPPESEYSNYRMAYQSLLSQVAIPAENIHRMKGESEDLDAAAREYEIHLRALQAPLDLVLLGMGDDGHTASLFSGTAALQEKERWCVATDVAPLEPHVRRLTLTYSVLNAARHVFILVTSKGKAERLAAVLHEPREITKMPVQGIQPEGGELVWMVDEEAAGLLQS